MNSAALILGRYSVSWTAVFTVLGAVCAMLLALSLWTLRGYRAAKLAAFFPAAILLALVLGRLAHWYCHPLQYASPTAAATDYFEGGFSLWGSALGVLLTAALFAGTLPEIGLWELLDILSPAAALGVAVGRLGSMFDLSDRGKFLIQSPALHRLPFSVYTVLSGETGQYRFATFFVQSLWCLLIAAALTVFMFSKQKKREGTAALLFALFYGAGQILLDSTRYDADFFRFNGFVHVPQILAAVAAMGAVAVLGARSIRRYGFRKGHALLFFTALAALGGSGAMEYLVQRHAERYALYYGGMAACLALLCAAGCALCFWKPRLAEFAPAGAKQ